MSIGMQTCYLSNMFGWLKKIVSGSPPAPAPAPPPPADAEFAEGTLQVMTVWQVTDQFLTDNPEPTVHGVHALVDAGATNLLEPKELLQVCDKIQEHGYQYPLNPTLVNELDKSELLEFLRWHATHEIEREFYANELTIRELIERFRSGA